MMEEYQAKRKYLRHLKKIAEIREGMGKMPIFVENVNLSKTKTKQLLNSSSKSSLMCPNLSDTKHTTTERIMRDFNVEKQNIRLVTKILKINSSIPLKKYQQQYEDSKKYMKPDRIKNKKHICFKLFDINFFNGVISSPQDYYQISIKQNDEKLCILKGNLFDIRKKQLKLKKKSQILLRIQGKNQAGTIKISEDNILDIKRRGQKIGHVVIEHISK